MNHTPSVRPPYRACPHARRILAAAIALVLHSPFSILPSPAAVPLKWTVETSRVQPAVFDVVRGETIELEAAFNSYGKPLATTNQTAFLAWQTNGMDSAWWITNAVTSVPSPSPLAFASSPNLATATFTPEMDPGAPTITGFIGLSDTTNSSPSPLAFASSLSYRAAFTLRFRKGPGATPNAITMPPRVLDLAHTTVVNPPWPTQADYAATTTVMKAELKAYVDGEIEGAGLVTPQSVTNAAGSVASNVVTKAYVESLGIESGLDTNAVATVITNHVTSGYLAPASALSSLASIQSLASATQATLSAAKADAEDNYLKNTGGTLSGVLHMGRNYPYSIYWPGWRISRDYYLPVELHNRGISLGGGNSIQTYLYPSKPSGVYTYATVEDIPDAYTKTQSDARYAPTSTAVTVASHASQLSQMSQSLSGKADASAVNSIQSQVSAIGAHLNAEDAHFVSTNYDSAVRLPEAYVEIKMTSGESNAWITIWREMTRWNRFAGTNFNWDAWGGFKTWSDGVTAEIGAKADRAWGAYDSETGEYSPDGYTQISSSNILIAANMSYKRKVTTGGAVWILQCNSGTAHVGGDTNGFFRIQDGDGVTQFEIVKGGRVELGADASGITVSNATVPPTLTIPYSVVAPDHPKIQVCTDLALADWKAEDSAQCAATVSWSGSSGAYVATVRAKAASATRLFVKATYMSESETVIRNNAPVGMDSIILNGTKYYLGTNTISGKLVLTLSTTNPNP